MTVKTWLNNQVVLGSFKIYEKSFFEPDANRMWRAPFKPTPDDWVLLVKKEKPSKAKIDTTIFERE